MTPTTAYLTTAAGIAAGVIGLACVILARRDYRRTQVLEKRARQLATDAVRDRAAARVERTLAVRLREDAARWNRETLGHMLPEEWGK